jgi:hypothetical protein
VVSFPQVSPPKPCVHTSVTRACYMPHPSHSSWFYHLNDVWWGYRSLNSSLHSLLHSPVTLSVVGSAPYSQTPSAYVPPLVGATKFHTNTKQQAKL